MSKKTKPATCIVCGDPMEIHIYMSAAKAKCESCKNQEQASKMATSEDGNVLAIKNEGPRIDGKPNKALRRLCCPYHDEDPMDIIGVIKSEMWGDIVSFQCRVKDCWTVVQISEQAKKSGPWRTTACGDDFEPVEVLEDLRQGKGDKIKEEIING